MNRHLPAQPIHPGEYLKLELKSRGWTQHELSAVIGRPAKTISQIISGKLGITPETAMQLAQAFNTSAELWLNLQARYQLGQLEQDKYSDIKRRAELYDRFPIKDMIKRNWISAGETVEDLEQSINRFFGTNAVNDDCSFKFAAKQNARAYSQDISPVNLAWLQRVKNLAGEQVTNGKFSPSSVRQAIERLAALLLSPAEIRHVPRILSEAGIRFVIVETLPNSKLDAACFWLDDNTPVIGMSLRYDRIDNFWFALRHELEHIIRGDGKDYAIIDEDVAGATPNLPPQEQIANAAAADFCVPTGKLENYLIRAGQYAFSEQKITAFAGVNKIHPGLVIGQLQNRTGKYHMLRKYLVPIRQFILNGSTYDGWGFSYGG